MERYVGLDVHSKQSVYVCQDRDGAVVGRGRFATTTDGLATMARELMLTKGTKVALETGCQANWVAGELGTLGLEALVIEAGEVRAKARRVGQKTDERDAFELCDGLRRGIYSSRVFVPEAGLQRLRRAVSRRRHFVRVTTQQINAAKFVLRSRGIATTRLVLTCAQGWQRLLERENLKPMHEHLRLHFGVWSLAAAHVEGLEKEIVEALGPYRDIAECLRTCPGVGLVTAATFIAVIAAPRRFATSAQVVSYLGLAPSVYASGEREHRGGLTKRGSSELRWVLVEDAHQARRPTHPLHPYYARIAAAEDRKRAAVAVAQRLARILWRMWRDETAFDLNKLNIIHAPRVARKKLHYQLKETTMKTT